ncbi:MAG TPA: DNA primase large subunit PriL [Candidatus Nanoarchaeia archaeon]|nr:DNA primase large subunit PriL [Candidatus Nanoarchaeia archaeon]
MQLETIKFTPSDLAKYPFLKETASYMKKLGLDIEELTSPELGQILFRAQKRLENAIQFVYVGDRCKDDDLEIPSFPVAIMLAIATQNSFIKKRYALAEAKQSYLDIQSEPSERLIAIARDFDWNIEQNQELGVPADYFAIGLADYLRNITHLRDEKWKLVNRLLAHGKVFLSKHDAARLLQEEVQRRIDARLDIKEAPQFPQPIVDIAEKLTELAKEKIGESEMEGFPKEVSQTAFPPCIVTLYDAASHGRHLSHVGRFTLTSFLVTIGMPTDQVAEVFKTSSDYNARLTRYQVEHIAGSKGSGTKYTPPSCSTLQTHGVCANYDEFCRRVRHPLSYYQRKLNLVPKSGPAAPLEAVPEHKK